MTRRSRRLFRLTLSVAVGVAVMLLVGLTARIDLGIAAGWATFVAVYCTWTWARLWPLDAVRTAEHSREEDPGRGLADVILIVAQLLPGRGRARGHRQPRLRARGELTTPGGVACSG